MKVLAPAGNFESVKMAVYNGADEIYLGVKDYNARNNIEGMDLQDVKKATDFAHTFGVRVFLTVNILFDDYELQSATDLIIQAYNLGVDAFILQDIGLISIISKNYPEIEIHASTQMAVHNLEGVRELEKLGIKRVVLSRETPLEEIKRIRDNSNIEIEYFVHGALCVAFSGNCYLSSYLFDASGNRGKCKQLCRLPYDLKLGNKKLASGYLLSAKDNNMLNRLKDLEQAGVNSLKIEGRARRPYYVGEITNAYRNAVDGLLVDKDKINLAFNRGFTEGYFNGNGNIISNIQNHVGIEVGVVTYFKKGKKFNEIYFSSNCPISKKSTLKFFKDKQEIATMSAFDLKQTEQGYMFTTTQTIEVGATVNLIADFEIENKMLQYKTKRKIVVEILAKENEAIFAKTEIDGKVITLAGNKCLKAQNRPLSLEELKENFNKNEYFDVEIKPELESVFVVKKELNEFRRNFFLQVETELTKISRIPLKKLNVQRKTSYPLSNFKIVENLFASDEKTTIYSPEIYNLEDVKKFVEECKTKNTKPVLNLPNFALRQDIEMLKEIVEKTGVAVVVNNLYALNFETEKIIGGYMNVFNAYSADYFDLPYIASEGDNKTSMPYMTLRHCPMKQHLGANCANCPFKDGYVYKMPNGTELKLKRKKLTTCTFYLT